jgi:glycerol-1-phosphatase
MLAERYDSFLLDLDGVLYIGAEPVPHAADSVAELRRIGKRLAFVTNNCSRTGAEVVEHLASVGVEATPAEIVTSGDVTAEVLSARHVRTAFVVGETGIRKALADVGVEILDGSPEEVEAVVVGWDRGADYWKLKTASVLIERGAAFVATNPDVSFPGPDHERWPGAGALVAAIEATTGVRAEVIGKPEPPILLSALARAGGGEPVFIGDRIDTDIAGAARLGWDSALVLTGITSASEAASADPRPTYVLDDLSALFS